MGAELEYDVPDDQIQGEFDTTFVFLKTIVDNALSASMGETDTQPVTSSGETTDEPQGDSQEEVVVSPKPGERVELLGAQVLFDPEKKEDVNRNEFARVRVQHAAIPGRYKDAKSYEPGVIQLILNLRKGDRVDLRGHYEEPWRDRQNRVQFAFIAEEIARSG